MEILIGNSLNINYAWISLSVSMAFFTYTLFYINKKIFVYHKITNQIQNNWIEVAVDKINISINHHLSDEYENLTQKRKDAIRDNDNIDIRYKYTVDDTYYMSDMVCLYVNKNTYKKLMKKCSEKKLYCYVSKNEHNKALLIKPDNEEKKEFYTKTFMSKKLSLFMSLSMIAVSAFFII